MLGTSSRRSAMMLATWSGMGQVGLARLPPLPVVDLGGEVVGALDHVERRGRAVGADLVDEVGEGHLASSGAKRARACSTMASRDLLGRPAVRLHDEIVAREIVVIDPVEVAVAPAVRRLARLDLAQALRRRPALAAADPPRPDLLGGVQEDLQRAAARLVGHERGQPALEHRVAARRPRRHLAVERAVDRRVGLGAPQVLLERQAVRLRLAAEDVAGVHVLEPEVAGDEARDRRLAAPGKPGDRDQHRRSLDVLHLLAELFHLALGREHQARRSATSAALAPVVLSSRWISWSRNSMRLPAGAPSRSAAAERRRGGCRAAPAPR